MSNKGPIFYVYEHWRPDKDVCFWVGKGHGNRAWNFHRNRHYNSVVKKLSKIGMCVEVRMVASGLIEAEALVLEISRVAFWRSAGVGLTNITNGGEGVSGLKHSDASKAAMSRRKKGCKNPEHSRRMRGRKRAKPFSDETLRKIGISGGRTRKGRKQSKGHTAKIVEKLKGRLVSPETRAKLRASNIGKKRSEQTKERLRISHLGRVDSAETRARKSSAQKRRWARAREGAM